MAEDPQYTILIIDDEPFIRQSYADFLEDRDFGVLTAENGRVGLELLEREKPDLILTDLRMPEVNGLEVLQRAREISPDTPLIVISGTGQISDSIQALRLGAWDYILKPVEDMSIIVHSVDQALERARLLRENREYQENLETLVFERTRDLVEANERLRSINTRLHKVAVSTRELTACSDIDRLGSTLLREFASHMMASGGSLFLVEQEGLRLLHTLDSRPVPGFIPFPLSDRSVFYHVINSGKPLLINDINREKHITASGWQGYKDNSSLIFPLPDESGRIVGVLSLHSKVKPPFVEQDKEIGQILVSHGSETLRAVQSADAVRESEARQRMILDSLRIGVVVVDPQSCEVVESNSEAASLIGVEQEALIGSDCSFFNGCRSNDKCMRDISAAVVNNAEEILFRADGSRLSVLRTIVPIQLNGRLHLLESFIDISRRREVEREKEQLESQLARAQKMEAVGTLAGGLAHDLNNALNGIFGPASILLNRLNLHKELPDEQLLKQLNRIQQSGYRISDMVSQLMAVASKQELSIAAVDLNLSVKHVVKIAQNAFDKSIEILPVYSPEPARTAADPTQIEQVLLNLAINSSHAMTIMRGSHDAWGGRLELTIGFTRADQRIMQMHPEAIAEKYWKVTVSDTGVGMTEKDLTQIFTPFFTTKDKGHGTGLGLTMVYSIVKQHEGFIEVESKPSVGTRFSVFLPVLPYDGGKEVLPEQSSGIAKGEGLVLIVDDEEVSRVTADEILKECGYETITAENGPDALAIFKERHREIRLVLLDMVMPKMSGRETYTRMTAIDPQVKVMLVSGFKNDDRVQSILEMGDIGFIQKPYEIIKFSTAVREFILS